MEPNPPFRAASTGSRSWRARVGLAFLSGLAGLAGLELAARLWLGPVDESNVTAVPDELLLETPWPGLRFRPRPGARAIQEFPSDPRGYFGPERGVEYAINSLGVRGPEIAAEKPAGVLRIAALGDSVLFGTGVHGDDVLSAVLERGLNARGVACQVLNFSCPAYDTLEEALFFKHVALELDPDLAFFLFFLNDAVARGGVITKAFNATGETSALRRASVLVDRLASLAARRASLRALEATYQAAFADEAIGWKRVVNGLRAAKTAADRRGIRMLVVIFPLLYRLDDYPFQEIHAKVARTAEELGYDVLDLLPAFAHQHGPSLWVHATNQHPNELGHALAARALEQWLFERGHVTAAPRTER